MRSTNSFKISNYNKKKVLIPREFLRKEKNAVKI